VITSHDALLEALHSHSRDTPTVAVPLPPEAGKEATDEVIEGWQRTVVGEVTLVVVELPHASKTASGATNTSFSNGRVVTPHGNAQPPPAVTY
jgi:hypothetical protein